MARTVNEEEFATKRGEILAAAQRVVLSKGYHQMSIRHVLDELQISSGAFHHYFGSRAALLEGLIEQIRDGSLKPLLPIVQDPQLSALEKLQGFFDTLDQVRLAQSATIVQVARVWYTDDNALVRLKVEEAVFKQRAPLLADIVRQGVREGVFTTHYPAQAGEVILSVLQGMGNAHARLFLALEQVTDDQRWITEVVTIHEASMEAIERVLGAPANALKRTDAKGAAIWMAALRGQELAQVVEGKGAK